MAFLLRFQAQGVSGRNEQSTQTLWRAGAPEARGPMLLHRLHRIKAFPDCNLRNTLYLTFHLKACNTMFLI